MNLLFASKHTSRIVSPKSRDSAHWQQFWRVPEFAEPTPACIAVQRVRSSACAARTPDILSFDAHEGMDLFFADSHALDFVRQGGIVAYGSVPARGGLNAIDSANIFVHWLKAASVAGDPQKLAQSAMITATCGLGLLDTSSVAESFSVASNISKLIRSLAGGENISSLSS